MISVEFAPNETVQDGVYAFKMLFQPWKWRNGKEITKLRQRLRKRFFSDKSEMFFFLTGRSALYYYLKALHIKEGSEVLVQAFTCEAVILPILAHKLKPVYIDIHSEDFSMNLDDLKKKYTTNAQVLILQHTFAITPIQRAKILAFAKEKKLTVIEDVAHGFQPTLFDKKTLPTTLLISFGRSKPLSGVFGGAIVTSNKKITSYLAKTEKHQQYPSTLFLLKMVLYKFLSVIIKATYSFGIGRIIHLIANYLQLLLPEITQKEKTGVFDNYYAKAFPNISALFIIQQLNRFNDVYRKKIQITKYYQDKLHQSKQTTQAYLRYPFLSEKRDQIYNKLKRNGILPGLWYNQVIAPKEVKLKTMQYVLGSCPNAEQISAQILNLPTFVTKKQAQKIVQLLKD
ncbi:MAG TPA: aminotransferase class I/II-fold pyridoxal phosphate-dependent enzyme [Candidatus Woesebacteria bacterium]|nr:aminotransferase class I/II-fold pyridoxal phosphate-dependent enzyme [Candidatus Woesebacteria bacterium]